MTFKIYGMEHCTFFKKAIQLSMRLDKNSKIYSMEPSSFRKKFNHTSPVIYQDNTWIGGYSEFSSIFKKTFPFVIICFIILLLYVEYKKCKKKNIMNK